MPYAANGQISQSPIEGGIEITDEQYALALEGILDGKRVTIEGTSLVVDFEPSPAPPEPAELTLEEAKEQRLWQINLAADTLVSSLSGKENYPGSEIDTWPTQQAEAGAWFAADEADRTAALAPWCATAAAARGITLEDFMSRVQSKVEAYRQMSAAVFGHRQKLEDQITAATDVAGVLAIEWRNPL